MIALNYQGASSGLELSSLIYLALILLVFSVIVNIVAQLIVRRSLGVKGRRVSAAMRPIERPAIGFAAAGSSTAAWSYWPGSLRRPRSRSW